MSCTRFRPEYFYYSGGPFIPETSAPQTFYAPGVDFPAEDLLEAGFFVGEGEVADSGVEVGGCVFFTTDTLVAG